MVDYLLGAGMDVFEPLFHLLPGHGFSCHGFPNIIVEGDHQIEDLPAFQRIMHDVALRACPEGGCIPAQVFRHRFGGNHRAVGGMS